MITEKKPNYSEKQIKAIKLALNISDVSFDFQKTLLADLVDNNVLFTEKTLNQVMAKVCHMSKAGQKKAIDNSPLYTPKRYTSKVGGDVIHKSELVEAISTKLDISSDVMSSLEKANKSVLLILLASLPSKA